jgi:cytochrome b
MAPNSMRPLDRATIRVWDPVVRILHWTVVLGVALAWLTSEWSRNTHETVGYVIFAAICIRLVWGFIGSRYARFVQFVRSPSRTLDYARALASRKSSRFIGHNPLGSWMILALLATLALSCVSGYMMSMDAFFGEAWVEGVHEASATGVLVLAGIHLLGVAVSSVLHAENLVKAMLTGKKRAAASDDIT